jgi:translocator protein
MSKLNSFWKLVIAIIISEGIGLVGSVFTAPAIPGWYKTLARPEIAPPNWVFAPVWTTLFLLMGIALWLVWKKSEQVNIKPAVWVYALQLVLNLGWSILFFGLHNPGLAFLEIIVLWFAILLTIIRFAKVSKLAAWLLVPYILWVSFASYLNFSLWQLN